MKLILTPLELVLAIVFFLGDFGLIYFLIIFLLRRRIKNLLSRPMWTTMAELTLSFYSTPLPKAIELSLRAQTGKPISRTMGPPWRNCGLGGLSFIPAQAARVPLAENAPVDTTTLIGPAAARPLHLSTPIIISAMAYDLALSKEAKIALAKGATLADTATNSGESGFFQAERDAAKHYILQIKKEMTTCDPVAVKGADSIEIHYGQGAQGTVSFTGPRTHIHQSKLATGQLPGLLSGTGRGEGADRLIPLPPDLPAKVSLLRELSAGVPIGVKLHTSDALEEDIGAVAVAALDFMTLDGAGAGTSHTPPVFGDSFGLSIATTLPRAVRTLQTLGLREKTTLIAGGGLRDPSDFLKCLALGADAVSIGSAAVMAAAHPNVHALLPFHPPTKYFWAGYPRDSRRLNVEKAAGALANFLESCRQEMILAARSIGVTSLRDLTPAYLVALDVATSQATGVPLPKGAKE